MVIVEGEPGIGKTRLLEELYGLAEARGATVTWGRSFEGGAAPAFWPWLSAWRSLLGRAVDVTDAVPPQLGLLLDPDTTVVPLPPSGAARFELFEGVAVLLERLSRAQPMVVILDDLQWADAASLELLSFLAGRITEPGVLIVAALRERAFGRSDNVVDTLAAVARRSDTVRLQLDGLGADETARLLEVTTRREVPAAVARAIHDRADGNPFYATELARLLATETDDADSSAAAAPIPSNVRDVVRRRLVLLPSSTVELLQLAAVIGRDFDLEVLTLASGRSIDDCLDDLEIALEQRLLTVVPDAPSTFRFAHTLVREVMVDDLSPLRRARHHLRVADAIEARGAGNNDLAEILAEHLLAAAPVGTRRRAAEALVAASDVAIRRLAFESAEDALERAVELWQAGSEDDDERAELDALARLVMLRRAVHGYAAAATTLDRAKSLAERLGQTHLLVHLMWTEWADEDTACRLERSGEIAHDLLDLGETTGDPLIRMAGHGTTGIVNWHVGAMPAAARELDVAIELASALPMSEAPLAFELELRLMSAAFHLYVHEMIGDAPSGEEAFVELSKGQFDPFATGIVAAFNAVAGLAVGEWSRLDRAAERGLALDPDARFTFWGCSLVMAQAIARLNLGTADVDDNVEQFEAAMARYVASGANTSRPTLLANLALGLATSGDTARAAAAVQEAYDVIEKYGERCFEPLVLLADGATRHAGGDRGTARGRAARSCARSGDVARVARAGSKDSNPRLAPRCGARLARRFQQLGQRRVHRHGPVAARLVDSREDDFVGARGPHRHQIVDGFVQFPARRYREANDQLGRAGRREPNGLARGVEVRADRGEIASSRDHGDVSGIELRRDEQARHLGQPSDIAVEGAQQRTGQGHREPVVQRVAVRQQQIGELIDPRRRRAETQPQDRRGARGDEHGFGRARGTRRRVPHPHRGVTEALRAACQPSHGRRPRPPVFIDDLDADAHRTSGSCGRS